jgi:hypothetical protein
MSKTNPYAPKSGKQIWTAKANREPISGNRKVTMPGSAQAIVAADGRINAQSKPELMKAIQVLANMHSAGQFVSEAAAERREKFSDYAETVAAAFSDKSSAGMVTLGEVMTEQIVESMGREGFIRRLLGFKALSKGDVNQIRVRIKDVFAYYATSNPQVIASEVVNNYVRPEEFYVLGNILMEEKEIMQDTGDLLDDKYNDGLEAMMVQEDKIGLSIFNKAAGAINDEFAFTSFTPSVMQHMKSEITTQGGIPVSTMLISMDIWNEIVAEPEFTSWYSEIEKHELVLEGNLGQLAGMNIITDGYRIPSLKVLDQGQVYMFGVPDTLGQIAQRGEMQVQQTSKANDGIPKRGWMFTSIESISVVNARAVVRGQRI